MRKTLLTLACAAAAMTSFAGCSSGAEDETTASTASETTSTTTAAAAAEEPTPTVELTIDRPGDGATVRSATVKVSGTVVPGNATVSVNGDRAPVKGGTWRKTLRGLERGDNQVEVTATAPGRDDADAFVTLVRKRSEAEIAAAVAARRERARRRAEAKRLRKQQAAADFKAGAKQLDYDQLVKNPDRYDGARVRFSGPILQIQDDGGSGFMLLQTTCDEYDFCDDLVYVDYDRMISSAADDRVTVYGTITGGYEYDTAAGGSNFVPRMRLRYIDE